MGYTGNAVQYASNRHIYCRFPHSDRIEQKIAEAWRYRAPQTAAVLEQNEAI
jgi:hypothetical protein